ncbi:MAG: HAMP domain-containing sensor histidine kinase [Deltaproteobacteria bacterium]|jgi:signal transduction histidine kinase
MRTFQGGVKMKWINRIFSPLFAFIGIQLVWALVVYFWIYWFVGRHREFRELAERYKPGIVGRSLDWLVLVEGLFLLLMILVGVYIIFLYWKRQAKLYKQQKNSISQVTHELKSPLASIQLHLETIQLRRLPPDKLERFIDTMLSDVDRLNSLISNLLMVAKLEHRRRETHRQVIDFSAFLSEKMERKRNLLPEGGTITIEAEQGLRVDLNEEEMETVMRNLFENAVLYSPSAPEITVCLKKVGKYCQLSFQDKGNGLEKKDMDKIFRMFYRVRRTGESIRGSGLGLYIIRSIINEHGGRIRVSSEGIGRGCCFLISLPLAR